MAAANGGAGTAGGVSLWSRWPDGPTLQAACGVLCAAAGAVLPGVLAGDAALQHHFAWLWPQLIALLGNKNPEVSGSHFTPAVLNGNCMGPLGLSTRVCTAVQYASLRGQGK